MAKEKPRSGNLGLSWPRSVKGIPAPSYKTFTVALRHRGPYRQKLKWEGRRSAYPLEPFYFELDLKTPRHGDRPFEIGHIDYTELDVEVVCSRSVCWIALA
jgi:putative transposase